MSKTNMGIAGRGMVYASLGMLSAQLFVLMAVQETPVSAVYLIVFSVGLLAIGVYLWKRSMNGAVE